jgi:MFS family permease
VAGTLVGGLILARFGWRAVFLSLGAVSLGWLWPWLATKMPPAATATDGSSEGSGPGYGELLGKRSLWAVSFGEFCYAWQYYLLLTWLPTYLVRAQHFSLASMAVVGASIYGLQAAAAALTGVVSDGLIRRGASASLVRKGLILAGMSVTGPALLLAGIGPAELAVPSLMAAGVGTGMVHPMMFSIAQTLSGPAAGGRWMGIQNMVGNFAGILAPIATGLIVAATGKFTGAFVLAAAFSVFGLFCWGVLLTKVEPVRWRAGPASRAPAAPEDRTTEDTDSVQA